MRKRTGIHLYINIVNFNDIIRDEESRTGKLTHAIHALDTFFASIESFGKKACKNLVIEKITGSRLHLYIEGNLPEAFQDVQTVSVYAYKMARYIKTDIPKYDSLKDFIINIGAAYGKFYDFEFTIKDSFSEMTTIGYAANFAAKLQALTGLNKISISKDIYESLQDAEKKHFEKVEEKSIEKYDQDEYYTEHLVYLTSPIQISEEDMTVAKTYANSDNLGEVIFTDVHAPLNFRNLSKTKCKKLEGIPVFADVRGFTSQFEKDDSNLDEMANKTQHILEAMYQVNTEHGGIHVQFQGDREISLYHNIPEQMVDGVYQEERKCFKEAVLASMRMIDAVKPYDVHIGVGEDFGRLFATKIGARGEKDNILLGETVIQADIMEDKRAGEDQVAITAEVYKGLKDEDIYLASQFKKEGNYYIATIGYQQYVRNVASRQLHANTAHNNYNGAWGDLV